MKVAVTPGIGHVAEMGVPGAILEAAQRGPSCCREQDAFKGPRVDRTDARYTIARLEYEGLAG